MDMQYKSISDVQFKTEGSSDGKMRFEGYLSVFGNVDSYGDIVEKGAFAKSIKSAVSAGRAIPVLENHGGWKTTATDTTPIGYFEELTEDDHGLYVKGVLIGTSRGKDMYTLLKELPKGAMGMSIGYRVIKSRMATREEREKSGVLQYLEEVELHEGSIVTFPANTEARVEEVKSGVMALREFERALKDEGYNARDAKTIVSIYKKCSLAKTEPAEEPVREIPEEDTSSLTSVFDDFTRSLKEEETKKDLEKTLSALGSFTL